MSVKRCPPRVVIERAGTTPIYVYEHYGKLRFSNNMPLTLALEVSREDLEHVLALLGPRGA